MAFPRVIKLSNGGDTRRVTLAEAPTFASLLALTGDLFAELQGVGVTFQYTDEDGDAITVATQGDCDELLRQTQSPIRLTVKVAPGKSASAFYHGI